MYLQNKMNFTEPGWNDESINLSEIECLVHIKNIGNSRTFLIQQNLQTNHHADIEITQKCIHGTVLVIYIIEYLPMGIHGKYQCLHGDIYLSY